MNDSYADLSFFEYRVLVVTHVNVYIVTNAEKIMAKKAPYRKKKSCYGEMHTKFIYVNMLVFILNVVKTLKPAYAPPMSCTVLQTRIRQDPNLFTNQAPDL